MFQDKFRVKFSNFGRASYNYAIFLIINFIIVFIISFAEIDAMSNSIISYVTYGLEFIFLIFIIIRAKNIADDLNDFGMRQFYLKFGFSLLFSLISIILYPILNDLIWEYYLDWLTNESLSLIDFGVIYSPEMITDVILAVSYILKYLAFVNLKSVILRSAEVISPQIAHLCSLEVEKLKKANVIFSIELIIGFFDLITTFFGFGFFLLTLADLGLLLAGLIFETVGFFKMGKLLRGPEANRYSYPSSDNTNRTFTQEPIYKSYSSSGVVKAKYCPKCGKTLPEDGTFCMSCGSEIPRVD